MHVNREGYHSFCTDEGAEYGSFEVFWYAGNEEYGDPCGWYWWTCYPGCLPDGDLHGPFVSSEAAYQDAME